MGSIYRRGGEWWVSYQDAEGNVRRERTKAETRKEAQFLLAVKEIRVERGGREPKPAPVPGSADALAADIDWWIGQLLRGMSPVIAKVAKQWLVRSPRRR